VYFPGWENVLCQRGRLLNWIVRLRSWRWHVLCSFALQLGGMVVDVTGSTIHGTYNPHAVFGGMFC
jgi:hypothetical protein